MAGADLRARSVTLSLPEQLRNQYSVYVRDPDVNKLCTYSFQPA
ncbi:MAG: hypothetical protein ACT4QA_04310 [Panacagrimonas sp.]